MIGNMRLEILSRLCQLSSVARLSGVIAEAHRSDWCWCLEAREKEDEQSGQSAQPFATIRGRFWMRSVKCWSASSRSCRPIVGSSCTTVGEISNHAESDRRLRPLRHAIQMLAGPNQQVTVADCGSSAEVFAVVCHSIDCELFEFTSRLDDVDVAAA